MNNRIIVGISACLLGEKVRYDGGHKLDHFLADTLGQFIEWLPVCPEVECGMPVPREAMRLTGDPAAPRLVTIRTKTDKTDLMMKWIRKRLNELERESLCGFVFKSRSPSSGMRGVKIYSETGMPVSSGSGLFAGAFIKKFPLLPVEDEGRLHDPDLRENFIERVFIYRRWKEFVENDGSAKGLVKFHTEHKLLILSHSTKHYSRLGKLVAEAGSRGRKQLHDDYLALLMDGLSLIATAKKNTNVLHHIMGYFKKHLSDGEKQELLDVIDEYRRGIIPLVVPVTLLNHYVRKYDEPYLKTQYYLNPHPAELMLRNHT